MGTARDRSLRSTLPCSVGRTRESDARFQPFRMTPYLARVPEPQGTESQLCCVLLAERVHSGYEGEAGPCPPPRVRNGIRNGPVGLAPARPLPQRWAEAPSRDESTPLSAPGPPGAPATPPLVPGRHLSPVSGPSP